MIKRIVGGLCCLFFSIAAFSQLSQANRAIISTHEGSVFIGHILYEDEVIIDLLVVTADTLHIQKGLIKSIRRNSKDILVHSGGKMHYTGAVSYTHLTLPTICSV